MKRLLSFLGMALLVTTSSASVVACATNDSKKSLDDFMPKITTIINPDRIKYSVGEDNRVTFGAFDTQNNNQNMMQAINPNNFQYENSVILYTKLTNSESEGDSQVKTYQSYLFSMNDQTTIKKSITLQNTDSQAKDKSQVFYYNVMSIGTDEELGFLLSNYVSQKITNNDISGDYYNHDIENSVFAHMRDEKNHADAMKAGTSVLAQFLLTQVLQQNLPNNLDGDNPLTQLQTYLLKHGSFDWTQCQYQADAIKQSDTNTGTVTLAFKLNAQITKVVFRNHIAV